MALSVRGGLAALEKKARDLPEANAGSQWIGEPPEYWTRIVGMWQEALRIDYGADRGPEPSEPAEGPRRPEQRERLERFRRNYRVAHLDEGIA
jgi:hypothetical protein